jgi:hypothetical protein
MALKVLEEFLFGLVGEKAKGEFSPRNEIVCSEEVGERLWDFALGVDVAVQHPSPELFRSRVHELDLIRLADHPIRHSFTNCAPVIRSTASAMFSRCWMLTVVMTSIPISKSS